jgi:hypothetical protein
MVGHDRGDVGTRAGTAPEGESVDIPKSVGWILGGFSLVSAGVGALTLAPRVVGAFQDEVIIALGLMLGAFLLAVVAGWINLVTSQGALRSFLGRSSRWWHWFMYGCLAAGFLLMVASIAIILIFESFVLGRAPVARLTVSVIENQKQNGDPLPSDTVKLRFEADGLSPSTFLVVDVLALPVTDLNQKVSDQRGDKIYRSLIGSDSVGRVGSDIQTEIPRSKYAIVVAEVYPGNKQKPPKEIPVWDEELFGTTHLCGDIGPQDPRACAWAQVPGAQLPPSRVPH